MVAWVCAFFLLLGRNNGTGSGTHQTRNVAISGPFNAVIFTCRISSYVTNGTYRISARVGSRIFFRETIQESKVQDNDTVEPELQLHSQLVNDEDDKDRD
jgi:hypothetical protein